MENLSKKELKEHYKSRNVIGGIYCVKCSGNGRTWLKSTKDIVGQKNRYEFFITTNSCPEPGMRSEWDRYGAGSFSFTVLEEIIKTETQTDREFTDDISILLEMWIEKQQLGNLL